MKGTRSKKSAALILHIVILSHHGITFMLGLIACRSRSPLGPQIVSIQLATSLKHGRRRSEPFEYYTHFLSSLFGITIAKLIVGIYVSQVISQGYSVILGNQRKCGFDLQTLSVHVFFLRTLSLSNCEL
jgi:hypothetical protein